MPRKPLWVRLLLMPFLLPLAGVGWVMFYFGSKKTDAVGGVDKTLPPCARGSFDCKNCPKPMVALSGSGDLAPCDGTIYFCKFATASTTTPACPLYNLQNYACTHGGGSCVGYKKRRNYYAF